MAIYYSSLKENKKREKYLRKKIIWKEGKVKEDIRREVKKKRKVKEDKKKSKKMK